MFSISDTRSQLKTTRRKNWGDDNCIIKLGTALKFNTPLSHTHAVKTAVLCCSTNAENGRKLLIYCEDRKGTVFTAIKTYTFRRQKYWTGSVWKGLRGSVISSVLSKKSSSDLVSFAIYDQTDVEVDSACLLTVNRSVVCVPTRRRASFVLGKTIKPYSPECQGKFPKRTRSHRSIGVDCFQTTLVRKWIYSHRLQCLYPSIFYSAPTTLA